MATSSAGIDRHHSVGFWRGKFVVEERYVQPAERRSLYRTGIILVVVGLVAFLYLLISVVTHTGFQRLDTPVEHWFDAQRQRDATGFMIALAVIFGPTAMPIIVAVVSITWFLFAKHGWRPILLAAGMLTGVILAEVLAPIVKHPRPPIGLMLFGPDHSYSFPSGHVLGTSDFFVLLAYLLATRVRKTWFTVVVFVVAIGMVLLQVASRLYLGYHYISDTTASMSLSCMIVGIVMLIDTRRTVRIPGERVDGDHSQPQVDAS
ncbi:phosphatase PAP2 family protein [Curtobacterium ammoniigenes]|uniref:phosphatase PAP2 family protein n=1 Tax=Curtobacterium ammoniigenes TaxID=395387 RepID=UPI00082E9AD0|nr:phosphatase PAP2 family protein [Curtobacterium ammoniigenes]